jgi:hypothetical protein
MHAIIEASSDLRPSLSSATPYQQLAKAFKDLGVYSAIVYASRNQAAFDRLWSLSRNEYGRGGKPVNPGVLLQPYEGLAVGIGHDGSEAYSVMVLLHDDESVADTNGTRLQAKVDSGTRLHDGRPWSDFISKAEIETRGFVVQAKFWSSNPTMIFDAWSNLESLFWSQQ